MIVNEIVTGIIAIAMGYLLGSTPSAYIAARLATGKDIRKMGGGNVGGLNLYREVGAKHALAAGIVDLCKGAAAVSIAYWLLDMPQLFVLLAGLGAVIGHNWMVWLKFSGGKGMGATFGALAIVMPLYGYWYGLLIFIGIIIIPFIITRNVALSTGTGILLLPLITWLITKSESATIIAVILGLVIAVKFLPTARAAWVRNKTKKEFIFDRGQRNQKEGE